MSVESDYGCYPASTWSWPVTYRWQVLTPFGSSEQELSFSIPPLTGDVDATAKFGFAAWSFLVARATSINCQLASQTVTCHRTGEVRFGPPEFYTPGQYPGASSSRFESACYVLHTGGRDPLTLRRFTFAGTPAAWIDKGLLTDNALRILERNAVLWKIAAEGQLGGGPLDWIVRYTNFDAGPGTPFMALGFRRVSAVRVLHHTAHAPEMSLGVSQ